MDLKLSDLQPKFLKRETNHISRYVASRAEADGIQFLCPKCYLEKGVPEGVHGVRCWEPSVPQDTSPTPGRWTMKGTSFEDLTLVAGSSSVALTGGCAAHFFVTDGKIVMC